MYTLEAIYFFTPKCEKYGYLSNFYKTNLVEEEQDKTFNCSEHYFMYYKCLTFDATNLNLLQEILAEKNSHNIKPSSGLRIE